MEDSREWEINIPTSEIFIFPQMGIPKDEILTFSFLRIALGRLIFSPG
jgi:hypothetical protein